MNAQFYPILKKIDEGHPINNAIIYRYQNQVGWFRILVALVYILGVFLGGIVAREIYFSYDLKLLSESDQFVLYGVVFVAIVIIIVNLFLLFREIFYLINSKKNLLIIYDDGIIKRLASKVWFFEHQKIKKIKMRPPAWKMVIAKQYLAFDYENDHIFLVKDGRFGVVSKIFNHIGGYQK